MTQSGNAHELHDARAPERGAWTGKKKPKHNNNHAAAIQINLNLRDPPAAWFPLPNSFPPSVFPPSNQHTPPPGNGTRSGPLAEPRYFSPTSLCRRQQPFHPTHVDSSTTALPSTAPGAPAANHGPHLQPPTLSDPSEHTDMVRPSGSDPRIRFFFNPSARLPRPVASAKVRELSGRLGLRFGGFQAGGRMVANWAVSAAAMIDRGSRIPTWRPSTQDAGVVVCVFVCDVALAGWKPASEEC